MKQFSLEEYIANPSRKVVTREGRSARIICTDAKGKHPIIALIDGKDGSEVIYSFNGDGRAVKGTHSQDDLFFAPEKKEKKEKHEGWVNVYKGENRDYFTLGSMIYDRKEDAEECRIEETYVTTVKIEWEE